MCYTNPIFERESCIYRSGMIVVLWYSSTPHYSSSKRCASSSHVDRSSKTQWLRPYGMPQLVHGTFKARFRAISQADYALSAATFVRNASRSKFLSIGSIIMPVSISVKFVVLDTSSYHHRMSSQTPAGSSLPIPA